MADGTAARSSRGHRTLCLPIPEGVYRQVVHDPGEFRRTLDDSFRRIPEVFPAGFARGYELKDDRVSVKQGLPIRRILLKDGTAYSIRPSFLMPYMTAGTFSSRPVCLVDSADSSRVKVGVLFGSNLKGHRELRTTYCRYVHL